MANLKDEDIIWDDDVSWDDEQPKDISKDPIAEKLLAKGVPQEALSQTALGARQPTKEELITLGLTGGGGLAARGIMGASAAVAPRLAQIGQAVGAAGGYTLSELINRKLNADSPLEALITGNDGRTTPGQAAKDFGLGLAFEAVPKAVAMGAGKLIPKGLIDRFYQSALKPSTTKGSGYAKTTVERGLRNELPIDESGLFEARKTSLLNTRDVNREVRKQAKAGDAIPQQDIVDGILSSKKGYSSALGGSSDTEEIDWLANKIASELKAKYGDADIPIREALKIKRATDKKLTTFWRRIEKGDSPKITPTQSDALASGNDVIRKYINRYSGVKDKNNESSELIKWLTEAEKKVVGQRNKSLVPLGTAETIGVSKSLGGNLPIAVAAVGGRALLNTPSIGSKMALGMQRVRNNQGGPIPSAVVQQVLYEQYLRDKEDRNNYVER